MAERPSPELVSTARDVLSVLDAAGIPACLIGGMVVPRWGQPRATTDVDLSVLAPYGDEGPVLDLLLERFQARRPDARAFALDRRVVLIVGAGGVGIDVALGAYDFEREAIETSTPWQVSPGLNLRTCSAEHLLIYKLVAARPQDLVDVTGIVRRQRKKLGVDLIRRWGRDFAELKEDPDLLQPFEREWRLVEG